MPRWSGLVAACLLLGLAGCGSGSGLVAAPPAPPLPSVSASDRRFVDAAVAADRRGIREAGVALQTSRDARVLALARHVLDAHEATARGLAAVAEANGIALPKAVSNVELGVAPGGAGGYVRQVVVDARDTIGVYEGEIASGYNDDLRRFADAALPGMRRSLAEAEALGGIRVRGGAPVR